MTLMASTPLIGQQADVAAAEMKSACLRLPHQGGACREVCFRENFKDCALLHHKFFCKEEW
jgi:hypothetical protein